MPDINEWNEKIYRNSDGKFVEGPSLGPKEFWEEFQIKSGPMFKDACWSHIPVKWTDDVRLFLKQVREELGDRVSFSQIKEKWCELTVYASTKDDAARDRLCELEKECIDRLIEKGVHPPREQQNKENGNE
jgi:hypothetical protein